MTRRYALVQLLRLGPLTRAEISAITGWSDRAITSAIVALCERGAIVRRRRAVYEVAP